MKAVAIFACEVKTAALPEGTTIEMTTFGMSLLLAENFTR